GMGEFLHWGEKVVAIPRGASFFPRRGKYGVAGMGEVPNVAGAPAGEKHAVGLWRPGIVPSSPRGMLIPPRRRHWLQCGSVGETPADLTRVELVSTWVFSPSSSSSCTSASRWRSSP